MDNLAVLLSILVCVISVNVAALFHELEADMRSHVLLWVTFLSVGACKSASRQELENLKANMASAQESLTRELEAAYPESSWIYTFIVHHCAISGSISSFSWDFSGGKEQTPNGALWGAFRFGQGWTWASEDWMTGCLWSCFTGLWQQSPDWRTSAGAWQQAWRRDAVDGCKS